MSRFRNAFEQLVTDLKATGAIPWKSRQNVVFRPTPNIRAPGIYFDLGSRSSYEWDEAYGKVRVTTAQTRFLFTLAVGMEDVGEKDHLLKMREIEEAVVAAIEASATSGNYRNKGIVRVSSGATIPHMEFPSIEFEIQVDGFW